MTYFYHYTSLSNWHSIWSGVEHGRKGLLPVGRLFGCAVPERYGLPEKAEAGVTFGFAEPQHPEWCRRSIKSGEPLLETILGHIGGNEDGDICLIKVDVRPTDQIFIANYRPNFLKDPFVLDSFDRKSLESGVHAYWHSLTPLAEYETGNMKYMLPEMVCLSALSLDRLSFQVLSKNELINHIRAKGGFASHKRTKYKPDYSVLDNRLRGKGEPREITSTPRPSLVLVPPDPC